MVGAQMRGMRAPMKEFCPPETYQQAARILGRGNSRHVGPRTYLRKSKNVPDALELFSNGNIVIVYLPKELDKYEF